MENCSKFKLKIEKIGFKIVFLLVIFSLSGTFLFFGLKNSFSGIQMILQSKELIYKEDIELLDDLKPIPPLMMDSLESNLKQLLSLNTGFGELSVTESPLSDPKQDKSQFKNKSQKDSQEGLGKDRVGVFKNFHLQLKGDFLDQIDLLRKLEKNYIHFMLIQKVDAKDTEINLDVKVYGN